MSAPPVVLVNGSPCMEPGPYRYERVVEVLADMNPAERPTVRWAAGAESGEIGPGESAEWREGIYFEVKHRSDENGGG